MNLTDTFWKRLLELYRARHQPEAMRPLSSLVWSVILALFVIGIVGAVVYATIVFTSVVEQVNATPTSAKYPTTLNRGELDETIREIRERGVLLDIQ